MSLGEDILTYNHGTREEDYNDSTHGREDDDDSNEDDHEEDGGDGDEGGVKDWTGLAQHLWQVMEQLEATQGVPPNHTDCDCGNPHPGSDIGWPRCTLYLTCSGPYLMPLNPPEWIAWESNLEGCLTEVPEVVLGSWSAPAPHFTIPRTSRVLVREDDNSDDEEE